MPRSEVLRARVDAELARQVRRWARDHDKDISETIRVALRRLMEQRAREKRAEEAVQRKLAKTGVIDPPKRATRAGGFR